MGIGRTWNNGDKRSNFNYQSRFLREVADCCGGDPPVPPVVETHYMWGSVIPAPGGMFPGDGDWYVTSVDVDGTNYLMTLGTAPGGGYYITQGFNAIYQSAAQFWSEVTPSPLMEPSLHVSYGAFSAECVFGAIGPQGTVVVVNWTWTDNIGTTVVGSTTLDQSILYAPGSITTTFDIASIVVPTPPTGLQDAVFNIILMNREVAYINGTDFFQSGVCVYMDDPAYWANLEFYARCQYGTQLTVTYDTANLSNIIVTVGPLHTPLVDLADPGYYVSINEACAGEFGPVPYTWV